MLVAALSASGCAPPTSGKPPAPVPSPTALFASDEEALAAAEEAYRAYQHVSDAIYIDGGADPERLLEVATQPKYEYEKSGYDKIRALGYHSTGGSTFDSATLLDSGQVEGVNTVAVLLCEDITGVDIRDANEISIVSSTRPDRIPLVVSFTGASSMSSLLLVDATDRWEGADPCQSE